MVIEPASNRLSAVLGELAESVVLASFERHPISSCYEEELVRVRRKIARTKKCEFARFQDPVNRNAFLLGCGTYTRDKREEHLLVGYGSRYRSTTKVESFHHVIGGAHSVGLPANIAHSMWDHYGRHQTNELLVFHNHPYNPVTFLLDLPPLASQADRQVLAQRAFNAEQLLRTILGQGRVLFYLGQNQTVKQFYLPSVLRLLERLGNSPSGG
jgi:hypothetical protein